MRVSRRRWSVGATVLGGGAALLLAGCSLSIPTDPEGTSSRVQGGELRVGVTDSEDWAVVSDDADPAGLEPDLLRDFADGRDSAIQWSTGSEQRLVERLERGELDLVIGGIRPDTPWADRSSTTMPYTLEDSGGGREELVMLARMGENAFVLDLDRFLQENDDVR